MSPWEMTLDLTWNLKLSSQGNSRPGSSGILTTEVMSDEATILWLLDIAQLLVSYGANPNAYPPEGSQKWTALSILENTFMIWVPNQAAKLGQALILAGARTEASSMGKLREWRKRGMY
jgi:hypothetical protein